MKHFRIHCKRTAGGLRFLVSEGVLFDAGELASVYIADELAASDAAACLNELATALPTIRTVAQLRRPGEEVKL